MQYLDHATIKFETSKLPKGFVDVSYDNDDCASAYSPSLKVKLSIGDENPELRHCEDEKQYILFASNDDGENLDTLLETDHYPEVIQFLEQIQKSK